MQNNVKKRKTFSITRKVYSVPYILFLLLFVVSPLVVMLGNAFWAGGTLSFKNFVDFFTESSSLAVLGNSILVGIITTLFCLLIGYPAAYILSKQSSGKVLVLLFMLPMWINFLIRTLATKSIFVALGIPLGWGTVIFGMVYNYLPFMILPLHSTLSGIDKCYFEAAQDLGADPATVFLKTTLPMSLSGIISGITMVFVPTISTFAITELLSNSQIFLFGDSIQLKFSQGMYGIGSVMSLIMLALVLVSNFFMSKFNKNGNKGRNLW
jgi:spermidine/putrescine transport system permease protein